jgi:hypothetical protein
MYWMCKACQQRLPVFEICRLTKGLPGATRSSVFVRLRVLKGA